MENNDKNAASIYPFNLSFLSSKFIYSKMLQTAKCYEKHQQVFRIIFFLNLRLKVSALPGSIPRANPDELLAIFNKYASVEKSGRKFMTANDFVQRYLIKKENFFSYDSFLSKIH